MILGAVRAMSFEAQCFHLRTFPLLDQDAAEGEARL